MFSDTKLKKRREELGYSQAKLANLLGISRPSYFNWESGKTQPNQKNRTLLAHILKVDDAYFESEYEIVEVYSQLNEINQSKTLTYSKELLNQQKVVSDFKEKIALSIKSLKNCLLVQVILILVMGILILSFTMKKLIMILLLGFLEIPWNRFI